MQYTLRAAKADDFEFVFQLNKANMRGYVEQLRGWDDEAERADMRRHFQPGAEQIIVFDGQDIGRLAVTRHPDRIDLRHIELLPQYQRQGIGTAIIQALLREARQAHLPATLMVLKLNPAQRLYERLGFRTVEQIDAGPKGIKCRMEAPAS
jgi:ribosomal protein S18 acetylase RimI-like enzyme